MLTYLHNNLPRNQGYRHSVRFLVCMCRHFDMDCDHMTIVGHVVFALWNEMKWDEMKWNETKRNETKRNETKRNETKRNETKWNETKRNEMKSIISRWFEKPLPRFLFVSGVVGGWWVEWGGGVKGSDHVLNSSWHVKQPQALTRTNLGSQRIMVKCTAIFFCQVRLLKSYLNISDENKLINLPQHSRPSPTYLFLQMQCPLTQWAFLSQCLHSSV